jgi:hypothetical protein
MARLTANPTKVPDAPGASMSTSWQSVLHNLDQASRALTVTGLLMLADIVLSIAGLILDPSTVSGAPTWMKPLKFAVSTCLFSFTLAFMIGQLSRMRRFAAVVGRFMAAALISEIVLIDLQAARHTVSHFNNTTLFDRAVYGVMGTGISVVLLSTVLILIATCLERISNRSLGLAIRLGLALSLAGMGTGILMTLPTPQQLQTAEQGKGMPRVGAHTVGAPDGGSGMPVTGWSADHGDLRIAHFVGLHGMQLLLLGLWLAVRARWSEERQTRLVWTITVSVSGAFATVLWQALRGQPFLRPDVPILAGWVIWLAITGGLLIWARYAKTAGARQTQSFQKMDHKIERTQG